MATYYVKTHATETANAVNGSFGSLSRSLVIEADSFEIDGSGYYAFYRNNPVSKKAAILVASVPSRKVLAVVEEDAYQGDYLFNLDGTPETPDQFVDAVWDIIDVWHEPEPEDETETQATETPVPQVPEPTPSDTTTGPKPETAYEVTVRGQKIWGFWYHDDTKGDVFVPYGFNRETAELGVARHKKGQRGWITNPLSETTPVPETIQ